MFDLDTSEFYKANNIQYSEYYLTKAGNREKVRVEITNDLIKVNGPKGSLNVSVNPEINILQNENILIEPNSFKENKSAVLISKGTFLINLTISFHEFSHTKE